MGKEAVFLPQPRRPLTVFVRQMLPVDPRWIPSYPVERWLEKGREGVLNDACPDTVNLFVLQFAELSVEVLDYGDVSAVFLAIEWKTLENRCPERVGRGVVLDVLL